MKTIQEMFKIMSIKAMIITINFIKVKKNTVTMMNSTKMIKKTIKAIL